MDLTCDELSCRRSYVAIDVLAPFCRIQIHNVCASFLENWASSYEGWWSHSERGMHALKQVCVMLVCSLSLAATCFNLSFTQIIKVIVQFTYILNWVGTRFEVITFETVLSLCKVVSSTIRRKLNISNSYQRKSRVWHFMNRLFFCFCFIVTKCGSDWTHNPD